jgi:hypothetical protein
MVATSSTVVDLCSVACLAVGCVMMGISVDLCIIL